MIEVQRGTARQLPSGRWVIEVETDSPELVLSPVGATWTVSAGVQPAAQIAPAVPAQTIGEAGAGDNFTLGSGRALAPEQQRAVAFLMELAGKSPFQLYAQHVLGVSDPPDAHQLAEQFLAQQCGPDALSDAGIGRLRRLNARFKEWWAHSYSNELTFYAECP